MSTFQGELTNRNSSSIVWSKTGLAYGDHVLELSPGPAGGLKVVVDAFTYVPFFFDPPLPLNTCIHYSYTVPTEGDLASSSSPGASATSTVARSSGFASAEPEVSKNKVPIIVGSIAGFIIFSIFLALAFYLRKQAKARSSPFNRKTPIPPLSHPAEDPPIYTTKGSVGTPGDLYSVSLADTQQPYHREEYVENVSLRPLPRPPVSPASTDRSKFEPNRRGF